MPEKDQNIEELKRQAKELESQIKKEEAKLQRARQKQKKLEEASKLANGKEILEREYEKVKGDDLAFLNKFFPLNKIGDYSEVCQCRYPGFEDLFECLECFYRGVKNQKIEPSEVFNGVSIKDYVDFFKDINATISTYNKSSRTEGETTYWIVNLNGENYVWFSWFDSYDGDGGGSDRWNLCNFKERQVLELDITLIDEDGNEEVI